MAEQVSRAEVYFNVVELIEGLDKPRNFREARIGFGEQFGLPRVRQIFSRWLKSDVQATQTARTLLLASNRLPVYITAEVGIRHLDTIGPGSVVRLQTRILQDATGAEETTLFLVVEASENRNSTRLRLTMRTIGGFPAPSFYASDSIPSFASATVTEKEENAFWSDDGTLDGNPTPYVWS